MAIYLDEKKAALHHCAERATTQRTEARHAHALETAELLEQMQATHREVQTDRQTDRQTGV